MVGMVSDFKAQNLKGWQKAVTLLVVIAIGTDGYVD